MNKSWLGLIGAVSLLPALLLPGLAPADSPCPPWQATQVEVGGRIYQVEVAADPEQRQQGLSERETLAPDSGMWFVLPEPGPHGFWMKDMRFALDLVWVSPSLGVLGVEHLAPCGADPCPIYLSPLPTAYVLEVNQGGFTGKVGDRVNWDCAR